LSSWIEPPRVGVRGVASKIERNPKEAIVEFLVEFDIGVTVTPLEAHPNDPPGALR
jgi:hypothetical protein